MYNKIQRVATTIGLGVVSVLVANITSAQAQQAYISGSSTLVLMNGATQSIGAELSAPSGSMFNATTVTVTPGYSGATANLSDNIVVFNTGGPGLTVTGGAVAGAPAGSSFTAAAAARLDAAAALPGGLSDVVSIIRAGAGVDGLD
ncbi:hypothetical protein [Geminocystis sp. CENA526]|uniref:hypothetical protein n=1 Tax=Geminocystis sp. CENA526 TaxID=1355871 RepID=UPI003D6F779D